jgi:uncharacterized protein (TIGR03435 family)
VPVCYLNNMMARPVPLRWTVRVALASAMSLWLVASAFADGPPADARFETASVKRADPSLPGSRMAVQPGRVEITGMAVRQLLRNALQVPEYQIVGFPDWVNSERFSILAKIPEGTPQGAVPAMLLALLKDRFQLALHTESREMPVYALIVAGRDGRVGQNLKPTTPECQKEIDTIRAGGAGARVGPARAAPPDFSKGAPCGFMTTVPGLSMGSGQSLQALVPLLTNAAGRPVVDSTGLTGLFDFTLRWAFDPAQGTGPLGGQPPGAPVAAADPDAPTLFTALQEQLGLKLDSRRLPMEVVVIDRIERPTLD